jgi:hypothetical protein
MSAATLIEGGLKERRNWDHPHSESDPTGTIKDVGEARPPAEGPQDSPENRSMLAGIAELESGVDAYLRATLSAKGYEWAVLSMEGLADADIARRFGVSRKAISDRKKTAQAHVAASGRAPDLRRALRDAGSMAGTDPARNSAGDWQIGLRSPENDPDRLAHLSMSMHDAEGMAAHVAGMNAPGRLRRPMSRVDRRAARTSDTSGPRPVGWGADVAVLEKADAVSFGEADRSLDEEIGRRAKVGWVSPGDRLAAL